MKQEKLIELIDSLMNELQIVRSRLIENNNESAVEYTDGIVSDAEAIRDCVNNLLYETK